MCMLRCHRTLHIFSSFFHSIFQLERRVCCHVSLDEWKFAWPSSSARRKKYMDSNAMQYLFLLFLYIDRCRDDAMADGKWLSFILISHYSTETHRKTRKCF